MSLINADKIIKNQNTEEMLRRALERLIQLYKDKVHFVFELLQNAEDAKARYIKFVLYDDRLEVLHDGKPFTSSNLQSLFNIGLSDKVNDVNQIGEFGVGFKSVFSICEIVKLYSCPVNYRDKDVGDAEPFGFKIVNFYRPEDVPLEDVPAPYTTRFVFPFAVNKTFLGFKSLDELRNGLIERLTNLSGTTLLFMCSLEIIEYDICLSEFKKKGTYMLDKRSENGWVRAQTLDENSDENNEDKKEEYSYLVFSKLLDLNGAKRSVDIAFAYVEDENGNYKFIKTPERNVFVYFPTGTESKLDFIVQGPYRTTPSRSEIPIGDENKYLAKSTAELVYESVLKLRDAGKLDVSLLNVLPIKAEDFYPSCLLGDNKNFYNLFAPVHDKIKELFRNEDVIPAQNGEFVNADHAILVRGSGLAEVFDDDDITSLLKSNKHLHWVTEEITSTRSDVQQLYSFLANILEIQVVNPDYLARSIGRNSDFLKSKVGNINWLVKFYEYLVTIPGQFVKNGKNSLMLPLKIVYTQRGGFVAPFRKTDDGRFIPNVFRPLQMDEIVSDEDIDFVNSKVYSLSQNFFDNILHIEKPNEYDIWFKAVSRRFVHPYNVSDDQHIKDIKNILKYLAFPQYSCDLLNMLRSRLVLKCNNVGANQWHNPFSKNIFFSKSYDGIDIEGYFRNIYYVNYIDLNFYENRGITYEQLKNLNVQDSIVTDYDVTGGTYDTGKPGTKPSWHTEGDFRWLLSISNLVSVLLYIGKNSDKEDARIKSAVIFKILHKYEQCITGDVIISGNNKPLLNQTCNAVKILLKKYWVDKYGDNIYNDEFIKWEGKWLYTDADELVSSKSISKYDLDEELYGAIDDYSKIYDILSFKKDQRDFQEDINIEFALMDAKRQDAIAELWLSKHFNINIEQLKDRLKFTEEEPVIDGEQESVDEFEFPREDIRNWDLIQHHAMQKFAFANPVVYQKKLLSVKVSGIDSAIKTYLQHTYREEYGSRFACQLCHKPFVNIESCQIEEAGKAERELEPLHLCLCPNCATRFRQYRVTDSYQTFLNNLKALTRSDIQKTSPVCISSDIGELWFTQTHIAEISELMKLQDESKPKEEVVVINNSEKKPIATSSSKVNADNGILHGFASERLRSLDYAGINANLKNEVFYFDKKYPTQSVPKVKVRLEGVNNGFVDFTYCSGVKKGERSRISLQVAISNKCFVLISV